VRNIDQNNEEEKEKEKGNEKENQIPSPPVSLLPPIQFSLPLPLTQSRILLPHTGHNANHISKKKCKTQHLLISPHILERSQPTGTEGEGHEKSTTSKMCTVVSTGLPANAEPALLNVYDKKKKMKNHLMLLGAEDSGIAHPHNIVDISTAPAHMTSSIKDKISNSMRERKECILRSDFRSQSPGVFDYRNRQLGNFKLENNSRARIPGVKTWEKQSSFNEGEWEAIPGSRCISNNQSNGGHIPGVIFPPRNSFSKQKRNPPGPEEFLSLRDLLPLGPTGVLFRNFPSFPPLDSAR
jgi:hypothetical protein